MIWLILKMSHLHENNLGRHKNELVRGLCCALSSRISTSNCIVEKRCVAAFKYLCNYLVINVFLSSMKQSCPACNTVPLSHHNCKTKLEDREVKSEAFYRLLNTIDKKVLLSLFDKVITDYSTDQVRICPCILYYKCLTIWRSTMRKQFLNGEVPRGIDKRLMRIIQTRIQEWEKKGNADLISLKRC